eukprot:TRINITY_DN9578_c0_g1_i1.p1 TRINITY_DN9578_c0_g1~~TRINITY_DN9578_c0_g1_i1.p1  ORF type:complete len:236 (+),score=53.38 TRINITY_DN9578_c0_g1_i1:41-709(+)
MTQSLVSFIISPEGSISNYSQVHNLINTAGPVVNLSYPYGETGNECVVSYYSETNVQNALKFNGFVLDSNTTLIVRMVNPPSIGETVSKVGSKISGSVSNFYAKNIKPNIPNQVYTTTDKIGKSLNDISLKVSNCVSDIYTNNIEPTGIPQHVHNGAKAVGNTVTKISKTVGDKIAETIAPTNENNVSYPIPNETEQFQTRPTTESVNESVENQTTLYPNPF